MASEASIFDLAFRASRCYGIMMEPLRSPEIDESLRHQEAAALLVRVADGDAEAFSDLYDRFSGVIFSLAMKMLRDREAASDALQEIFVAIWERAGRYDPRLGKAVSWMLTVSRNHCCDQLRSLQRKARAMQNATEELRVRHEMAALQDSVDAREDAERIHVAMGTLPSDQRVAIELAFLKGLTQMEVAEALKQPLGTIKARIRRGMQQLRVLLQNTLGQPEESLGGDN